jgi:hypothetical protein
MAIHQQTRAKSVASLTAEDIRMLEALKKASAEAKKRAAKDGVPFIGGKRKSWGVAK